MDEGRAEGGGVMERRQNGLRMDAEELEWWRHFQTKCFNWIPVGHPLLGDRFKIMVRSPLDDSWEDVWPPKSDAADTSTAEMTQLPPEQ